MVAPLHFHGHRGFHGFHDLQNPLIFPPLWLQMEHLGFGWVFPPWFFILTYKSSLVPSKLPNEWIELYQSSDIMRRTPKLPNGLKCEFKLKIAEEQEVEAHSLLRNTLRVKGCVGAPRWD